VYLYDVLKHRLSYVYFSPTIMILVFYFPRPRTSRSIESK